MSQQPAAVLNGTDSTAGATETPFLPSTSILLDLKDRPGPDAGE